MPSKNWKYSNTTETFSSRFSRNPELLVLELLKNEEKLPWINEFFHSLLSKNLYSSMYSIFIYYFYFSLFYFQFVNWLELLKTYNTLFEPFTMNVVQRKHIFFMSFFCRQIIARNIMSVNSRDIMPKAVKCIPRQLQGEKGSKRDKWQRCGRASN